MRQNNEGEDEQSRPMLTNITLYWTSGQIASWKVRLALEEKGLQGYRSVLIVRSSHVAKDDEFWKGNEDGIVSGNAAD